MTPAKCPNPNCPFLFDPSQVPPGAVIACPQCGMQFTLGQVPPPAPAYAAPPQPAYPGYPPQPGYGAPPGYPYAGGDLGAAPGPDVAGMADDYTTGERPVRKSGGIGGTILALGGILALVGTVLAVVIVAMVSRRGQVAVGGGSTGELRKLDMNFALKKPSEAWAADAAAQNALGVNVIAYKRADPDAWIALSARDYATQEPRPSELREKVMLQLNKGFDNVPPDVAAEQVDWAGQKADRYSFRAVYRPTGEACSGDCYVLSYKGVAYWFYSWCPENAPAEITEELAGLRDGFRVLDQRDNWKPTTVAERVIRNKDGLFRLTDYERVWTPPKLKDPTDEDAKAVMLLEGVLKSRDRGDKKPTAELVVMVLDGSGNPTAAGKAYVEQRYKKLHTDAAGNAIKFEELANEPEGDPPVGPETPDMMPLRMKLTVGGAESFRSADKLVVVAAVESEGKTVVAEAACPWKERAVWEKRLIQMVGSLKAGN